MSQIIVGIKVTKKKGSNDVFYHNYFYEEPFSTYDKDNAEHLEGRQVGVEFSYEDIGCHVGDEVEFEYTKGFQGKAQLTGCKIIKASPQPIGKK